MSESRVSSDLTSAEGFSAVPINGSSDETFDNGSPAVANGSSAATRVKAFLDFLVPLREILGEDALDCSFGSRV